MYKSRSTLYSLTSLNFTNFIVGCRVLVTYYSTVCEIVTKTVPSCNRNRFKKTTLVSMTDWIT